MHERKWEMNTNNENPKVGRIFQEQSAEGVKAG
jgi:hypothetical protein